MSTIDGLSSPDYWEDRHQRHIGTWKAVGIGSHGRHGIRKAHLVNTLIMDTDSHSLLDIGCGDGKIARYFHVDSYHGTDVSTTAITQARKMLKRRPTFTFTPQTPGVSLALSRDLHISLDVILHLIDDDAYELHLQDLFIAGKAVGIYSTDHDEHEADHVRHRSVTLDVAERYPEWKLVERIPPQWPTSSYGWQGSDAWWLVWTRNGKSV